MKRILLGLVGLVVAFFLGRAVFVGLASDETKIRWLVEQMEDGYNAGDLSDSIGPLHDDWRHEGYQLTRELLKAGLFQEFREARERETRERTSRVDLEEGSLSIQVQGDHATLAAVATFSRMRQAQWEETWKMRVEADVEKGDGGWKIRKSRHEDLEGTQLSR